ncbi:SRPBCC family protein [Aquimarina gracilis]|uniref:SRPBCC family protein n=1 Tax=Aquimarina gracilis TaxID=874422 RepID=A0ABU5ZSA6_9FLAO|nr:SRPBCC family protein [Aquimarina gracilis]MEB3344922.1 SRPBCC family protein [Aquimarina gracilis]
MTTIKLQTYIKAPAEDVFNLSRNIDFHILSAKNTNEKAIAGKAFGLIGLNETVTWKGKHFGQHLTHQSKITLFKFPTHFTDEMIKGNFRLFKHQHFFNTSSNITEMIDILDYQTPYGILGKIFDRFILKKYLTNFLVTRNRSIKSHLESKRQGRKVLQHKV